MNLAVIPDLGVDDKKRLSESVTSHFAGKLDGAPLDLVEIKNLARPGYSLAELPHWGYRTFSVAPNR
ncbi:hypothetical protein H0H81_008421, partial [Sphagnurus paluster]